MLNLTMLLATRGARSAERVAELLWRQFERSYATAATIKPFYYQDMLKLESYPDVPWKKLTSDYVSTFDVQGQQVVSVKAAGLTLLAEQAMIDIAHLLRPGHLQTKRRLILKIYHWNDWLDYRASHSSGKKGQYVWTDCKDEEALSHGIYNTYTSKNLRYSQVAPLDMYNEINTATNLPAQIEIYATNSNQYDFLFMAKGGGSANKTYLFQQTKALLNPDALMKFLKEKIMTLGTAACPPYHLAIVIGGTSAEYNLKTVKQASARYLDNLPTSGNEHGRGFRDLNLEMEVHRMTQQLGIGAQFGGKYFCHDVRVIRLPRHGASCPVGMGVSCSADRQILGKISSEGIFLEQLETNPAKYLPDIMSDQLSSDVIKINMNAPMKDMIAQLDKHPAKTRLSLTGTLIVGRDIAHAKLKERLNSGEELPQYFKDHPVYYAGPAKQPEGYPSGSFGPTTAGRMDAYVDEFQAAGGSMIMLAKGNRSKAVTDACKKYGGFYLGSIGGPAAVLAQDCIKKVELLEYPELGMEAIYKVEVENFPAFIVVDNKGNDFFDEWQTS